MAIRREAFAQIGGFDDHYFLYFEETDLCRRLRRAGREIWHVPTVEASHIGGASNRQIWSRARLEYRRSQLRFYRKHHGTLSGWGLLAYLLLKQGWTHEEREHLRRFAREPL